MLPDASQDSNSVVDSRSVVLIPQSIQRFMECERDIVCFLFNSTNRKQGSYEINELALSLYLLNTMYSRLVVDLKDEEKFNLWHYIRVHSILYPYYASDELMYKILGLAKQPKIKITASFRSDFVFNLQDPISSAIGIPKFIIPNKSEDTLVVFMKDSAEMSIVLFVNFLKEARFVIDNRNVYLLLKKINIPKRFYRFFRDSYSHVLSRELCELHDMSLKKSSLPNIARFIGGILLLLVYDFRLAITINFSYFLVTLIDHLA